MNLFTPERGKDESFADYRERRAAANREAKRQRTNMGPASGWPRYVNRPRTMKRNKWREFLRLIRRPK